MKRTSKVVRIVFKDSFELESTLANFSCLQISKSIWAVARTCSKESPVDASETACNQSVIQKYIHPVPSFRGLQIYNILCNSDTNESHSTTRSAGKDGDGVEVVPSHRNDFTLSNIA